MPEIGQALSTYEACVQFKPALLSIGKFDDWEAFTYQSNGAPVCYVFSSPTKSESEKKIAKRDPMHKFSVPQPLHSPRINTDSTDQNHAFHGF